MPENKKKLTVLLADDHPQTVAACREVMLKLDLEIVVANALVEAERVLAFASPAAILLDAALPGGDIKQLLSRLRPRGLAVMLFIPPRFNQTLLSDLRPLVSEILAKPFCLDDFEKRMRGLCFRAEPAAKYSQEGTGGRPAIAESSPDDVPHEIGGCRLEKVLGRGASATVHLGRHLLLNIPVVIKMIPMHSSAWKRSDLERFLRGARAAARIQHPNIVPVVHAGQEGDFCYLIHSCVEGDSLQALIDREGMLSHEAVKRLLMDVSSGLSAAHNLGVIHRDVKPGNIVMTLSGKAMLTDFGLARLSGDNDISTNSELIGTAYYMSPEQCQKLPADARSDLYSLGATAYHALTGHPPFDGIRPVDVLHAHVYDPPASLEGALTPQAKPLARLVMKLLEKNPAQRFATACDLLACLDRL